MKLAPTNSAYLMASIVIFLTVVMPLNVFAQTSAPSPTLVVQLSVLNGSTSPTGDAPAVVEATRNDMLKMRVTVNGLAKVPTGVETVEVNPDPIPVEGPHFSDSYFLIKAIRKSDEKEIAVRIIDTMQRSTGVKLEQVCFFEIRGSSAERTASMKANWKKLTGKEENAALEYLYSDAVHNLAGQFRIECSYVSHGTGHWDGKIDSQPVQLNVTP